MSRGDPERIYQAQRAGILARLTQQERVNEREAEDLISALGGPRRSGWPITGYGGLLGRGLGGSRSNERP